MNCCYIFGALPCNNIKLNIDDSDYVIAADAGLYNLKKLGITPNLIVGDFDSLEYTPDGDNVIKHPVMKNETDTILAIDIAINKGYRKFIIYGGIGGRLDHTYANIQTAAYVAENGGIAVFTSNEISFTVIKNNYIEFNEGSNGILSVFAHKEIAEGVTETGLLYELENATLSPDYPLGVSNEFTKKNARISVENGALCIMWESANNKYSIGGYYE